MPHKDNGEVDLSAYGALVAALNNGRPEDFDAIPLGGQLRLTNPQSGLAFDLEGVVADEDCELDVGEGVALPVVNEPNISAPDTRPSPRLASRKRVIISR